MFEKIKKMAKIDDFKNIFGNNANDNDNIDGKLMKNYDIRSFIERFSRYLIKSASDKTINKEDVINSTLLMMKETSFLNYLSILKSDQKLLEDIKKNIDILNVAKKYIENTELLKKLFVYIFKYEKFETLVKITDEIHNIINADKNTSTLDVYNKDADDTKKNNDVQNTFDMDDVNKSLMNIIIALIGIIMIITTLGIFLNSCINYIIFLYFTINQAIIESDDSNLDKMKIFDTYSFKLLNYVFCYQKMKEELENDKVKETFSNNTCPTLKSQVGAELSNASNGVINYVTSLFNPIDSCDTDSFLNIFGGNKLYSIPFKLIYFIIITIFLGIVIYLAIFLLLGGLRNYNIVGKNMFSYVFEKGEVYLVILLLVILYSIMHSVLFKHLFTDNVYNRLYNNYLEILKLDMFVYDEMKNIENEKDFLNMLSRSSPNNIDIEYETNMHNQKIIDNIISSGNDNIKSTKIFLYAIYIYLKRQNANDINIIKIINKIITQAPDNNRSIRSLLNIKIDSAMLSGDINNIVSRVVSDGAKMQEFDVFDFNNLSAYNEDTLMYKVAFKVSKFYDILINMDDKINFSRVVYYLNIYLVLEIVANVVYMLLLLLIFWIYSDKNPFMKRIIDAIKDVLFYFLDELKYAFIGV